MVRINAVGNLSNPPSDSTLSTRGTALSPTQAIVTDKRSVLSSEHAQHGRFFQMNYSFKAPNKKTRCFSFSEGAARRGIRSAEVTGRMLTLSNRRRSYNNKL